MARPQFDPLRFTKPQSESAEDRRQMIAQGAYFMEQKRNFAPGNELEDWLAAEAQVDGELMSRGATGQLQNS